MRGKPTAVVISEEDYRELTSKRPSLVDHILSGAPWPDELVEAINDRTGSRDRDVEF